MSKRKRWAGVRLALAASTTKAEVLSKHVERRQGLIVLAAALASLPGAVRGGSFTWNGSTNASWDTSANWTRQGGGTVPQSNSDVFFPTPVPGTAGSSISLSNGEVSSTLTFNDSYLLSGGTLSVTAGTVTVNPGKTATIGTVLTTSNVGGLSIAGGSGGVVDLVHSNNTYAGDWKVQGGTLRIEVGTATSGGTSAIAIASGAALEINGVNWGRDLTLSNGATLRGVGNAFYGKTATVDASASVTLASGPNATDQLSNSVVGSSIAGGSGATIHVAGAGTVQLLQSSTYLGNWSVDSGTLQVAQADNTGTGSSAIVVNNTGVLQLTAGTTFSRDLTLNNGAALSTSSLSIYSGNISIGSTSAVNFALGPAIFGPSQLSLSHILTGGSAGSSITTSGDGSLVLPFGASSFIGAWNLGGTTSLLVGDDSNLGDATNTITLNGGTLIVNSSGITGRQFTLGSVGGTILIQTGNTFTMAGSVTANANPLALTGFGTFALYDATARTGSTTIQNGTAELHTSTALGSGSIALSQGGKLSLVSTSSNQSLSITNGTLQGSGTSAYTGAITVGAAPVVLASGASASDVLTIGDAAGDLTGSGTITVNGSGSVALPFSNSGYSGNWQLSGGNLRIGATASLGSGVSTINLNGGALALGNNVTLDRPISLGNGSAIRIFGSGSIASVVGTISIPSAAAVTFDTGAGIFNDLTIADAPNELTGGGAGSTINVIGAGSVELPQPSNYSGTWAISGGASVRINADSELGNASNPITLADSSAVGINFGSGAIVTARNITSTNGILQVGGGGSIWTINGSLTASGTLDLRGDGNLIINGPQSWAPGSMLNTIGGAGIMQLNTDAGSATSRNLTINAQFAPITLNATQHLAGFVFGSGSGSGRSILTAGGNKVIVLNTIVNEGFTSPAQLDLTDNKLIVVGGSLGAWNGTKYAGITGMIKTGRNTGNWNGDGIITSMTAAGTASRLTTLAVATAGDVGYGGSKTFGGQSVSAGDVLVVYTYAGDANLDGKVNADDYFQIDSNYNHGANVTANNSFKSYHNGDFNYDGSINGDDFALIDASFAGQGAAFSTAAALGGVSAVPEPGLGALVWGGLMLLSGRSRRR